MDDIEHVIRRRAYELWEQVGCPEGRSDEFWHAALAEIEGEGAGKAPVEELGPPIEEPPEALSSMESLSGCPESVSSSRA